MLAVVKNLQDKYNFSVGYLKERGTVADQIEKLGIPVIKFDFFSLFNYLKKNKISILHTHLYRANILGRLAGKLAGITMIISSQRSIDGWKKKYHVWLDSLTAHFADLIIANSQAAKALLINREKIPPKKIIVVYNGVKSPIFSLDRSLKDPIVIGCITRLHKEKGVYLIPEIAKNVLQRIRAKFLIVGDGPEKDNLKSQIARLKLQNYIEFAGWRNNLENVYSLIDLLLLPSEEESFPQVVLEAFSYGVPVVASNVGGVRELVVDGNNGFLINSFNAGMFAEAIVNIAENRSNYHNFSKAAINESLEFSLEKMINSISNIYAK